MDVDWNSPFKIHTHTHTHTQLKLDSKTFYFIASFMFQYSHTFNILYHYVGKKLLVQVSFLIDSILSEKYFS